MLFNINDYVTRKSYNNDILFQIIDISNNVAKLSGVNIRLCADSTLDDLEKVDKIISDDSELLNRFNINLDRSDYFYLPGKILHIDSDNDYLKRCMKFYKKINVKAYGLIIQERDIFHKIVDLIDEYKPDILVITGHDAYYKKKGKEQDNSNYENTLYFINAVREARKKYSHNELIIIAGACQSNYEELIKAGANFASSPKRINIHALDPAIVAGSLALSPKSGPISLIEILEKTKYGKDGMGGIITNGTMYVGYPR